MSDLEWMEAEAYALADRVNEQLDKAYKQGVRDAWRNVKVLWNDKKVFSVEWSAEEMMLYAENDVECREAIEKIADKIGIQALYAIVSNMKGGDEDDQT